MTTTIDQLEADLKALTTRVGATEGALAAAAEAKIAARFKAIESTVASEVSAAKAHVTSAVTTLEGNIKAHLSSPRAVLVALLIGMVCGGLAVAVAVEHLSPPIVATK